MIIDLIGAHRLDDLQHIEATLKRCAEAAGARVLHIHLHQLAPDAGISGMAVLSEGQISVHSRNSLGYAALDIFMSGGTTPHLAVEVLKRAFSPTETSVKEHVRSNTIRRRGWEKAPRRTAAREKARVAA